MSLRDPNPVDRSRPRRIAMVIANRAVSPVTSWPVGFWWSELTHPWWVFEEVGYVVELFSVAGGRCEADALSDPDDASGYSAGDLLSRGFIHTPRLRALVEDTRPVSAIDVARFDAIVVAGGQSPMFTFESATDLHRVFAAFHDAGRIACALCHGVALLAFARGADGEYLARGRTVTGFANVEEDFADEAVWQLGALPRGTHLTPWRIEDRLRAIGANDVQGGAWRGFAVRDRNLITGQQNFSGRETAELVVQALGR